MAEDKKPATKKIVKKTSPETAGAQTSQSVKPSTPDTAIPLKKIWKKLDDWNFGLSGKIILILVMIGFIGRLLEKL